MKVSTDKLKEIVKVLSSVAGMNSLKPITCLLQIKAKDNKASFTTTNGIDTMYASLECEGELDIAVDVQLFTKLVLSLSKEEVELFEENNILNIHCGGKYKIPAVYNSLGQKIPFRDLRKPFSGNFINNEFKLIKKQLGVSKADNEFPIECYRNYYFGDNILATNVVTASKINKRLFEENILLFDKTVEILSKMGNNLRYNQFNYADDLFWLVTSPNKNIEFYQYGDVMKLFNYSNLKLLSLEKMKEILKRFNAFKYEYLIISNNIIKSEKEDIIEELDVDLECQLKLRVDILGKFLNTLTSDFECFATNDFMIIKNNELEHIISKSV